MKTKQQFYTAALATLLMGTSSSVLADTVVGNAYANILTPASLTENTAMAFADIGGVGTVTLSNDGTDTVTPGAGAIASGAAAEGAFTVTGAAGQLFTLSAIPDATLTHADTSTMTVASITPSTTTGTVGDSFTVGGSITLTGAETAGAGGYTGTYNVTVNYQ